MMDSKGRLRFGAHLKYLRDAKGLTQRQVAEAAGISNPYLAQLERGQRNPPSREILTRLARVYHVSEQKLWEEAGYIDSPTRVLPADRVEWAFDTACRDPEFLFGTRMDGSVLTLEAKAAIVELYERASNVKLLDVEIIQEVTDREGETQK